MTAIYVILGLLGAYSFFVAAKKGTNRLIERRRIAKRQLQPPPEFHFRSLDLGLRVVVNDQEWLGNRRAEIVSLSEALSRIPMGLSVTVDADDAEMQAKLVPNDVGELTQDPHPHPGWKRYVLALHKPLAKQHTIIYTLETRVSFKKPPRKLWSWCSPNRVEHLTLRAVFPGEPPKKVSFQVWDTAHKILEEEGLSGDLISCEYRKELSLPTVPNLTYALVWQ